MIILAIDLGVARTGLAICDKSEILASPIETISERNYDILSDKIVSIIKERNVESVVLGYPKNMDGSCGESAKRAEDFRSLLLSKINIDINLWDERLTTVSAANYLNETNTRGKKRKSIIDTVSAVIILQNYIDSRKNGTLC